MCVCQCVCVYLSLCVCVYACSYIDPFFQWILSESLLKSKELTMNCSFLSTAKLQMLLPCKVLQNSYITITTKIKLNKKIQL